MDRATELILIDTRLRLTDCRLRLILDAWNESKHPRDEDGKFASVSATGANTFVKRGFANKQKLMNHWKNGRTHREEFPEIKTAKEYEQKALELLERPVGGNILGHADKDGNVIRYDRKNNIFAKGNPQKGVRTMMKPKDGLAYYLQRKEEDLERGGRD